MLHRLESSARHEREHAAESLHLSPGHFMERVAREPRIADLLDMAMLLKVPGDRERIGVMAPCLLPLASCR
jgi:hypothetical protein